MIILRPVAARSLVTLAAAVATCLAAAGCGNAGRSAASPSASVGKRPAPPHPAMVAVEAGSFRMGNDDAGARRPVAISRKLLVAANKVTFADYDLFCAAVGRPPLESRWDERNNLPVIGVDWYDAVAYCNWLSAEHGLRPCYSGGGIVTVCDFDADGYRLPTEAEWEWVARGGILSRGYRYAGGDDPLLVAWFAENSGGRMRPVGTRAPNELGLYDLSGNLYEWCWDFYDRDAYASAAAVDPLGPPARQRPSPRGPERVRRGGSWRENRESITVAFRSFDSVNYPGDNGFRLFRTAPR